jgi:nucleotide-binding universal stress UspA family protein
MSCRILVASDSSAHARQALAEAIDLARTNNAAPTVMTVMPTMNPWLLGGGDDVPVNLDELDEQAERNHRRTLDAAVARVPGDLPSPPLGSRRVGRTGTDRTLNAAATPATPATPATRDTLGLRETLASARVSVGWLP